MENLCNLCGKSQSEDGRSLVSSFFTRTRNRFCAHCGIQMSETWLQLSRKAEASAVEKLDFLCNSQSIKTQNTLFPDVYLRASDGLLVPAHKHMLARKSVYFEDLLKNLKHTDDVVDLRDMSQGALQAFVLFFYTATVSPQELETHIVVLLAAAINYSVYYLRHQCENYVADRLTHRKLHWAYGIANETGSLSLRSLCETFVLDRINGKTVIWALDIANKFGSLSIRRAALAAVLPSGSISGADGSYTTSESQPLLSSKVLHPVSELTSFPTLDSCSFKRKRSMSAFSLSVAEDDSADKHALEEVEEQKKSKVDKAPQDQSQISDGKEEQYDSDYYEYSECSSDTEWERDLKPGYEWDFDQPLESSPSDDESPLHTFGTTSQQENSSGSGSGSVSTSISNDDFQKATNS